MTNKNKHGLGRGLDALINPNYRQSEENSVQIESNKITNDDGKSIDILVKISTENIKPNPYQPRTNFDQGALDELKKSILENGLIQPITVRRAKDDSYELISGERRLRACREIGFKEIPAYIVQVDSAESMLALSLIENIQREELNAIEIAFAYKRLMEECSLSQEEIAKRVGKDRSTITNSIRLLKLPSAVQQSLVKNEISAGHARALINLPTENLQLAILGQILKKNLSVRKVESLVKQYAENKESQTDQSEQKSEKNKREDISRNDIEGKLRSVFGTKVMCKQKKDGAGEIVIEFYSNDELERLFELFEIIERGNY
ncbi:MAG: ParB/RepB/Spo0J family partition protein [Melioribacteraceae bacterium]|nr:ParB/RepB/Spo0J family partition protein [Melioribacteraceae bacterium]MCF8352891.1 ParB/RepB/Spo0J family partition protein [Melioribacteraceae bacterium]MCF8393792.1 ParB/RepB/Spo0J family partition protein [Melioribacteraceae bacterium]MCF8417408.1 ParB/RepB/Spo0J family partition protein [Melioribacteraceae bacterium]